MTALLDVNVLMALAWPNHVHHAPARSWFNARRKSGWATCHAGGVDAGEDPAALLVDDDDLADRNFSQSDT